VLLIARLHQNKKVKDNYRPVGFLLAPNARIIIREFGAILTVTLSVLKDKTLISVPGSETISRFPIKDSTLALI
jgi:hypothetical protein